MNIIKKTVCLLALGFTLVCSPALSKTYHIGASLLTQQHPFYIELANAMKAQAEKDQVTLSIAIANQDLNKQISDVEDFITKKVDAIILSPVDSKGVQAAIIKAQRAGIPVLTVDIPAANAQVVSHIATDNYAGGLEAGKLMGQLLNGKGTVAIIDYPTVQSVVDRINGFKEGLKATPAVKIVAIQTGITRAEALAAAQNMLQANPNLSGIFAFGDDAALAAVIAARSAKRGDIKIIGFDGMPEAINAVNKEPTFVAVIQQYPDQLGTQVIQTAVDYLNGQSVPKLIPVTPGIYMKPTL